MIPNLGRRLRIVNYKTSDESWKIKTKPRIGQVKLKERIYYASRFNQ